MKIYDSVEFGKAVKKRRKEMGYTQKYLSDFTGYSASFISDLENGKSTIELGKAIKLANILGLDILVEER
ncbi:MAG: helix-turn-helix transcriptional regulator [Butyrivibrio sp.]|nr:helix-turn-helix transcriptional regulator [Butyrivibrio sp.]